MFKLKTKVICKARTDLPTDPICRKVLILKIFQSVPCIVMMNSNCKRESFQFAYDCGLAYDHMNNNFAKNQQDICKNISKTMVRSFIPTTEIPSPIF